MSASPAPPRASRFKKTKLICLSGAVAAVSVAIWILAVPFPAERLAPHTVTSTRLVDREGRLLRELLNPEKEGRARWLEPADISPHMKLATVQTEDKRFEDHVGVDPIAIGRALVDNARAGRVISGASTLTQQTVKLTGAPSRRGLAQKAMEAVEAIRLERTLGKEEILAQYLNRAPYGNQLFGVEAAARRYFGKPAAHLSLAEATLLAGIPQAPTLTEPLRHRRRAVQRQRSLLLLMRNRGAISEDDCTRALAEPLVFASPERPAPSARQGHVLAPHFTDRVLERLGDARPAIVQTTLDLELQEKVEGIVRLQISRVADRGVSQGAAIVIDNRRDEVLAWVGSRDYDDAAQLGANDGVVALRQPGSTLKPFVYGLYLERGGTAADMFADLPTQFSTDSGVYVPKNYDQRFHGPVSLRDALGSSLNIPAVIAAAEVGPEALLGRLRVAGFESLTESSGHYGLGLALGNGEVTLLELASAYAALGRLGAWRPVAPWREPGAIAGPPRAVFSREVSTQLLDVLQDDAARSIGFDLHGPLALPFRVAAKTGTSTDFRDNWAVGTTPEHTVAVWVGNFDGSPMQQVSGSTGAAPILRQIFQALHPTAANPADALWFPMPRGLRRHSVCALSGQPAAADCPASRQELFIDGRQGASDPPGLGGDRPAGPASCAIHHKVAIDTRNGLRAGAGCDRAWVERRLFVRVPPAWLEWAHGEGLSAAPAGFSPLCPAQPADLEGEGAHDPGRGAGGGDIRITPPLPGDQILVDRSAPPEARRLTLRATTALAHGHTPLTWFVDGEPLIEVHPPYTATWAPIPGVHVFGVGRGRVEAEVKVTVR